MVPILTFWSLKKLFRKHNSSWIIILCSIRKITYNNQYWLRVTNGTNIQESSKHGITFASSPTICNDALQKTWKSQYLSSLQKNPSTFKFSCNWTSCWRYYSSKGWIRGATGITCRRSHSSDKSEGCCSCYKNQGWKQCNSRKTDTVTVSLRT